MNKLQDKILTIAILGLTLLALILFLPQKNIILVNNTIPSQKKSVFDRAENSQQRWEHFFRLTRDPQTNSIPRNIRSREVKYAKTIEGKLKSNSAQLMGDIDIVEAGPNDVGGRTRGLGLDSRDSDIILAGSASGGMWKSIDRGGTWTLKSQLGDNLGVTSLVQNPLNPDTWYYSTGEFLGASSRARGGGGQLYGSGIYTSTDNGDTWSQIAATSDNNVSFDSEFDFISRVEVSPITGTKFFASNAVGIYRSSNNFVTNTLVLGDFNDHIFSDVQVASDGTVIAILSGAFSGTPQRNPGVYISKNDGISWTEITPSSYPSNPGRGVIGVSESNPEIFYVFVAGNSNQPSLYYFDISDLNNIVSANRTNNIPDFGSPVGDLNLQGGYNMVCEVKPNDPNFVIIGGTNLFRSTDGFSTLPEDENSDGNTDDAAKEEYWIGGYASENNISQFRNHHPDQHAVVFDPNSVNTVISSHDGGISRTSGITSSSVRWIGLNNGYNVTQFYTASIHPDPNDSRILGGTQDNGSPFFNYSSLTGASASSDISSGDGAYSYLGENYLTTSSQRGRLIKYDYSVDGEPSIFSYIAPVSASNQLFIHPYVVNHTNEDFIFYPDGNKLFRNNVATSLLVNQSNSNGTSQGWTDLEALATTSGTIISTLAISTSNPSDVLYYASFSNNSVPQIYRLSNSKTATTISDLLHI